jgi:hypothetical protein
MKRNTDTTAEYDWGLAEDLRATADHAQNEVVEHSESAATDTIASAVIDGRTSPETDESSMSCASELRARAVRYRALAETLSATNVIAVVEACARKLDMQAASIEMNQAPL